MASTLSANLFEDNFEITDINAEGKKFTKVSRLTARSENYEMELTLDYNSEIYKLSLGQKFSLLLTRTLNFDGTEDGVFYNQNKEASLLDNYEYAMHGKIFKIAQKDRQELLEIYASFGGLLMCLKGDPKNLLKLTLDLRLYLLMRRIDK